MGFKLTNLTLKNLFRKPDTRLYPFEPQVYTGCTRGHIENDIEACTLCGLCMRRCPATALIVNKKERTWIINPFSCIQCNACVRICPSQSLSMHPEYTPATVEMTARILSKPVEDKQL